MKNSILLLLSAVFILSCQHKQTRVPQNEVSTYPKSEDLFLRGNFSVKKGAKILDEDRYGKPLDLSVRRPVVDLSNGVFSQSLLGTQHDQLIGNYYHEGKFYFARIKKSAVQRVFFQLAYFPPVTPITKSYFAAHSLIRFEFSDSAPLELVAEMPQASEWDQLREMKASEISQALDRKKLAKPIAVKNIVMSAEAQWTKDDPKKSYDLVRGARGAFIQIVRIYSHHERIKEIYMNGNPVNQFEIEVSPQEASAVLQEAIATSEKDGLSKLYDTFWYNCTTLAFDVFERGINAKDNRIGVVRDFLGQRIPLLAPKKLKHSFNGAEVTGIPLYLDPSIVESGDARRGYIAALGNQKSLPAAKDKRAQKVLDDYVGILKASK